MGTKAVDESADTSEAKVAAGAENASGSGMNDGAKNAPETEGKGTAEGTPEGDGEAYGHAGSVPDADAEGTGADRAVADGADADDAATGEAATDEAEADADAAAGVGASAAAPAGIAQGAGAVVAAALGVIGLSGGWIGTVASARESLIGQLRTSQGAGVAEQVQQVYGDSWKTTALIGGFFAFAALVVGVGVLLRPAFGDPERVQAPWIKSVAWAGVALGVIGLALAIAKYTDVLLGLPSTS